MTSKKALDDKHEKLIRALLRDPDNRKCINCTNNVRDVQNAGLEGRVSDTWGGRNANSTNFGDVTPEHIPVKMLEACFSVRDTRFFWDGAVPHTSAQLEFPGAVFVPWENTLVEYGELALFVRQDLFNCYGCTHASFHENFVRRM